MTHELARLSPGSDTVVFLGPTLPKDEAQRILPTADILPPVRFGDLYALIASQVDTVIIIDGVFHGHPPVWQREIAAALAAGMRVVGAASMGALRALELAPYGMIGIGQVVRWYRDGQIEGDDEVALLHADEEMHYLPLSLPLVDVRAALDDMVLHNGLHSDTAKQIIKRLKSLSHADRARDKVLAIAEEAGVLPAARTEIAERLGPSCPGLKARDAKEVLTLCRDPDQVASCNELILDHPVRAIDMPVRLLEPVMMRAACARDGARVRLLDVLQLAKNNEAACAKRVQDEGRRWFLQDWCTRTAIGPDEQAFAEFVETWIGLHCAGNLDTWLCENGLCKDELRPLLAGRCVEDWLAGQPVETLPLTAAAKQDLTIDFILADWARRLQITPPDECNGSTATVAQWLIRRTPGHFGAISWHPDRALIESLQVEGEVARLALGMCAQGGVDGC